MNILTYEQGKSVQGLRLGRVQNKGDVSNLTPLKHCKFEIVYLMTLSLGTIVISKKRTKSVIYHIPSNTPT